MCGVCVHGVIFPGGQRPFFWLASARAVLFRRAQSPQSTITTLEAAEADGRMLTWAVDSSSAVFGSVYDLMARCLSGDGTGRPSAREVAAALDGLQAQAVLESAGGGDSYGSRRS